LVWLIDSFTNLILSFKNALQYTNFQLITISNELFKTKKPSRYKTRKLFISSFGTRLL